MPSTLEQLAPTRAKLTIDIPFADLEPAIAKAYSDISQSVSIPGFRKGKVPPRLIDQRFGRGAVLQEAINGVLPEAYQKAIEENSLRPLGQPEVDITELNDGENVVFTAEVDVCPEFTVADPTSISVQADITEVTDEVLDERISMLRERFATVTEVDRKAKKGDVVVFNLTASQDGKALDDAEAEGMSYTIGSGTMIEGLDKAVTGLKAGESTTFTSTLVGGPHRGEEAEIAVEVTKVQEQELPALDDDFAQMISEFDTLDQMRADLRDNLERMARMEQATAAREKVLEAVVEATEFELPEKLIETERDNRHQAVESQLAQAGLTLEQYLDSNPDEQASTPEEFWKLIDENVERNIRSQIILDQLVSEGDFEVSREDMTQMLFARAQANGTTPDQEAQHMVEHDHVSEWMGEILRGKALGAFLDKVNVTDQHGAKVELSRLQADGTLAEEPEAPQIEGELVAPVEEAKPKKAPAKKAAAKKDADDKPAKKPAAKAKKADEAKADEADEAAKPAKKPAAKKAAPAADKAKKAPAKKAAAKAKDAE